MNRERVVDRIRQRMAAWYRGDDLAAACLYWAGMTCHVLGQQYRVRAILQAGTAQWPCIAEDNGVSPTHFSYVWEPGSLETRARLQWGLMPEMHVWAAIPSTGEIIDVTTRYLVRQAKERAGIEWTGPTPPDFLWVNARNMPRGVVYVPDAAATLLALRLLASSAGGARAGSRGR